LGFCHRVSAPFCQSVVDPEAAGGSEPLEALSSFVCGDAGWPALQQAGLHVIERSAEGVLMEEAPGLPMPRPTAPELARGLLAYASSPTELRDWARVVVCVADLGDASLEPEAGRLLAAVWDATEGETPTGDTLVVLRRFARSGMPA
jgi:hypothetical protein